MKTKNKKGVSMIMFPFILFVLAVITVFLFLAFFKYHITVFTIEEYNFNKYQTLPLSIFSAGKIVDLEKNKYYNIAEAANLLLNNFGNEDYFKTKSAFQNELKKVLPSDCYKFILKIERRETEIEKTEICDTSQIKFEEVVPLAIISNGVVKIAEIKITIFSSTLQDLISAWPR